jgi:hypothetical protein
VRLRPAWTVLRRTYDLARSLAVRSRLRVGAEYAFVRIEGLGALFDRLARHALAGGPFTGSDRAIPGLVAPGRPAGGASVLGPVPAAADRRSPLRGKSGGRGIETRVLIVDRHMVTPDRDSGSVRLLNIVELLRQTGHAVTFASECLEYRPPYGPGLEALGVEVLRRPQVRSLKAHLQQSKDRYGAVILCRADTASKYIDLVRTHCSSARVVYDTVDLHYLREQRQADLVGSRHMKRAAALRKRQELETASKADVTVVVSPVERHLLLRKRPGLDVEVLSNIYEPHGRIAPFEQRRDLLFIGNFDHPPNSDAVRYFVREVLPLLRACEKTRNFPALSIESR